MAPEPEWFPAIENRGEGIFITISAPAISAWRDTEGVKRRATQFIAGTNAWVKEHPGSDRRFLGPAYLMLHSLAHLLLTRISLDAAIRRRRCASGSMRFPMSGCSEY